MIHLPDFYTDKPERVRIVKEYGDWLMDGVDSSGKCTARCWGFDSFSEAIAAVPEFIEYCLKDMQD